MKNIIIGNLLLLGVSFGGLLIFSELRYQIDSRRLKRRVLQERAKAEAEEQRWLEELQDIPKPERPEDVTVENREVIFKTSDGNSYRHPYIGLYCKGKFVDKFQTKTEAEAARLQYLHDNGVESAENFAL